MEHVNIQVVFDFSISKYYSFIDSTNRYLLYAKNKGSMLDFSICVLP